MKRFQYVIRYLMKRKSDNFIKIMSLSLGIAVGLILFARITFELSYDKFYPDAERLYFLDDTYVIDGEVMQGPQINAPIPDAMYRAFPEVESATITASMGKQPFSYDKQGFSLNMLYADSMFFRTLGFELKNGDSKTLAIPDNIFLSEKMAKVIFGKEDPVGKVLLYDNNRTYIVQGIFANVPENSHLKFDAVGSFDNIKIQFGRNTNWDRGDSYIGYVKLLPGTNPDIVNEKIPQLEMLHRSPQTMETRRSFSSQILLEPIGKFHFKYDNSKNTLFILSLLGLVVLIVAAMNYVLIVISSLPFRAKSIGIHKCSGATYRNIFSMFMYETGLLILFSLLVGILLLLIFRMNIEQMIGSSFFSLFTLSNLWLPGLVVVIILLIAGLIPSKVFASVSVLKVFRSLNENRSSWKKGLLFIQFAGVSFVILLLAVMMGQYYLITHKNPGYQTENIVFVNTQNLEYNSPEETLGSIERAKQELAQLGYVQQVATHAFLPNSGYGGQPIADEKGEVLFSTRWTECDNDYINVLGAHFTMGSNFTAPNQIIVNETFVRKMGWEDSPIGKTVWDGTESYGEIVGVVKDYLIYSLHMDTKEPVLLQNKELVKGYLSLHVADLTSERTAQINEKLKELFPDKEVQAENLQAVLINDYVAERNLKEMVLMGFFVILLIALAGLIGYVADEIMHRTKEIAIRKINGAGVTHILHLLSKEVTKLALPAIVLGITGAYLAGTSWLQNFSSKISMNIGLFIIGGLMIAGMIVFVVSARSWHVANENPVKSIKSE